VCALVGCREYRVSEDASLRLSFSCDTLTFDTVFTAQGSATAQLMVYNRNANAVEVDRIWLTDGKAFQVNVDGEPQLDRLTNLQINGGDSMFVFIRVDIDPTRDNNPVLISDQLCFHLTNNATQQVELEAYGQDVIRIGHKGCGRTDTTLMTFKGGKPYLIYDTLVVDGLLKINAGATIYMHSDACLYALGNVSAKGTAEQPICIRGDRLDRLFEHVPYLYAGGSWNGIYLQAEKKQNYEFEYVDILSGNIGLYCININPDALPTLQMDGCRIHNHSLYGLVLVNTNALVTNTEISNCASYCVYCAGGTHRFIHTTVASYFGSTDVRIQSAVKEDAAAVYIDNLSKNAPATVTSFINSIITGYRTNQVVVATPFDHYYTGIFAGNYLKTDTLQIPGARDNVYWQSSDTAAVFRNTFFKYKEYVYYDFQLDSLSPAIGIGDSIAALPYPTDRNGVSRAGVRPDAGCYQKGER
jgi:hypothetical protein